jgi:hypothetical protein
VYPALVRHQFSKCASAGMIKCFLAVFAMQCHAVVRKLPSVFLRGLVLTGDAQSTGCEAGCMLAAPDIHVLAVTKQQGSVVKTLCDASLEAFDFGCGPLHRLARLWRSFMLQCIRPPKMVANSLQHSTCSMLCGSAGALPMVLEWFASIIGGNCPWRSWALASLGMWMLLTLAVERLLHLDKGESVRVCHVQSQWCVQSSMQEMRVAALFDNPAICCVHMCVCLDPLVTAYACVHGEVPAWVMIVCLVCIPAQYSRYAWARAVVASH